METLSSLFLFSLSLLQYFSGTYSTTLTIKNNCNDIIWPAVLPNPNSPPLPGVSGFSLAPGASQTLPGPIPSTWSGRVWARTHCTTTPDGLFLCATGDCGTGAVDCSGTGKISPPVTVAGFSAGTFYVSVVDGYNLPVMVSAGDCGAAGCTVDTGSVYYPPELRATAGPTNGSVGIKSACSAFNQAEYCCTGSYASASNCKANSYSELFKKWCPQARTYEYDYTGTEFPCAAADYVVNFCTPVNSGYTSTDGTGIGNVPNGDNSNNIFGNSKVDSKFGIIIGVAVGVLGIIVALLIWRCCRKSECEPCSCTLCSLFSCTCCLDDHDHTDHKC